MDRRMSIDFLCHNATVNACWDLINKKKMKAKDISCQFSDKALAAAYYSQGNDKVKAAATALYLQNQERSLLRPKH